MDIQKIHQLFLECSSVSIDTRNVNKDSFFVAIKGERFDANTFANEALKKGAKYVIIDNKDFFINDKTILVKNSLHTLQQLATFHRVHLKLPIIALTGSNGKTTTKELINCVLSKKYNTKATVGNLNNHIGVPLTILSFDDTTEIGIVEMGANHQKEIEFLCSIAKPDYGYITNFGKAHLEGFGGVEGVIRGKSEMYDYLILNGKKAFVNYDDEIQVNKTNNIDRITFSKTNKSSTVFIKSIEANPMVTIEYDDVIIKTNLIGLYNANNVNAAITIGNFFNVPTTQIKNALELYTPENNRSQLITKNTNQIILDAYNANPSSMKVALDNFLQLDKSNKIAILGDMFELGDESFAEHQLIVNDVSNKDDIIVYFIGNDFYSCKLNKNNFCFFKTFEEFSKIFKEKKIENSTILIKGSRGMSLERTLEIL